MWARLAKWFMEVVVGTVRRIFTGTVNRETPVGPAPTDPGNYPLIVQLSINKIENKRATVSFELDRDGELVWGVFDADLAFDKDDITTGSLSSAYGTEAVLGEVFTEFDIENLSQGTDYIFAYYTRDANDESDILDEIEFTTTGIGDPGGLVTVYGDEYNENYR